MDLDTAAMDAILQSHQIPAQFLRADDFDGFYAARKALLLQLIEKAMGKTPSARADAVEAESDSEPAETLEVQTADS